MLDEIKYGGYTNKPSDYDCPDGDLSVSMNCLQDGDGVRALMPPAVVLSLGNGWRVVYVHKTVQYTHYIVAHETRSGVYWGLGDSSSQVIADDSASARPVDYEPIIDPDAPDPLDPDRDPIIDPDDDDDGGSSGGDDGGDDGGGIPPGLAWYPAHLALSASEITDVKSIGNTLLVMTTDAINYLLWKGDLRDGEGDYKSLGTHLPECPISFGLKGAVYESDRFQIDFDGKIGAIYDNFGDENTRRATLAVMGAVNKFVAEHSREAGRFMFPFLVRYAYRLYDGSLTMQSCPVLMRTYSEVQPLVYGDNDNPGDKSIDYYKVVGVSHRLDFAVLGEDTIATLSNWKDIITGVDIFVSAPLYTYDQSGEVKRFLHYAEIEKRIGYSVCCQPEQAYTSGLPAKGEYVKRTINDLYRAIFNKGVINDDNYFFELPSFSSDKVGEHVRDCSDFYILKSYRIEELSTERQEVDVPDDYLQSLEVRERLPDDYDSHDRLAAGCSFVFNSRLNLGNITKELWNGYHAGALLEHSKAESVVRVYFHVRDGGRDIVLSGQASNMSSGVPLAWLYYPNPTCDRCEVVIGDKYYTAVMRPHDFLSGSYCWFGFDGIAASPMQAISVSSDKTVRNPNKVYTTEVNNPFHFPVTGINTVGTGTVLGLSSSTTALSEGQFGQFPLYVFTDDGIWALQTGSDGGYQAKQPVSRDVCVNAASITQTDDAVLFVTDRGLMILSGAKTVLVSGDINGHAVFSLDTLPGFTNLFDMGVAESFKDYLRECRLLYDYEHQRVIVFKPGKQWSWVYSLDSHKWGMLEGSLVSPVPSYPDCYAMDADGHLLNFGDSNNSGKVHCCLVTRPMKLGAHDVLKTIRTVLQRGYYPPDCSMRQVLYGSRDLFNWFLVSSSGDQRLRGWSGTPYKYFRLCVLFDFGVNDRLAGASVDVTRKGENRAR